MNDKSEIQLIYSPGKDNCFGHAALPRKLPALVPHLIQFMENCTISSGPYSISIEVYAPTQFDDRDISKECYEKVAKVFGPPNGEGNLFMGSVNGPSTPANVRWCLLKERFAEALDFIVQGHPWPKQVLGPVSLNFEYDFHWRNPLTAEPLLSSGNAGGSHVSRLSVYLERSSYIQPELVLPYEVDDQRLYEFLGSVVPKLPFAFSIKHLRRRLPLKSKPGYRVARISSNELSQLRELSNSAR